MTAVQRIVIVVTSLAQKVAQSTASLGVARWAMTDNDEFGRCKLSHNLMNQLTVIVICCGLLKDEPSTQEENSRRLFLIQSAARSIAQELSRHECDYEEDYEDMFATPGEAKPQLLS